MKESLWKRVSMDIEGNGLINTIHSPITEVYIFVFMDVDSQEVKNFHDYPELCGTKVSVNGIERTVPNRTGSLLDGAKFFYSIVKKGGKVNGHNFLAYDLPVLHLFYPKIQELVNSTSDIKPWECIEDTYSWSKLQQFDRAIPFGGSSAHSLDAWGIRVGIKKPVVSDWKNMDGLKIIRCIDDVQIQRLTYLALLEERKVICEGKFEKDFEECSVIDAEYIWNSHLQATTGCLVDIPHMQNCLEFLDKEINQLETRIEPLLPPTLTVNAPSISKKELYFKLYGKYHPTIKEEVIPVMVDGVVIMDYGVPRVAVVKDYYQPHVKFTTTKVERLYAAICTEGELTSSSYEFLKQKDAREWLTQFNYDKKQLKLFKFPYTEVTKEVYNHHCCNYFGLQPEDFGTEKGYVVGAHTRIEFNTTRMTQHAQVKDYLLKQGWKPTEWNYKKENGKDVRSKTGCVVSISGFEVEVEKNGKIPVSPKLTEDSFGSLPEGVGKDIATYNTYQHRRRFIQNPKDYTKGLLNNVREDGRISCGLNVFGTATGRSSQTLAVNIPSISALYGEEIRRIFIAEKGRKLVGADQKSAQLSIAAYYANNYEYYNSVASGVEYDKDGKYVGKTAHCVNARGFGLVSEEDYQRALKTQDKTLLHDIGLKRKAAKSPAFATIFGASGAKVASSLGCSVNEGTKARESFLRTIGLDRVIEQLEFEFKINKYKGGGFITLPFGYKVYTKSSHKIFNYLDQGTEAIAQKIATNYVNEQLHIRKLDAGICLSVHDELLVDAEESIAEEVGEILSEGYRYASNALYNYHLELSSRGIGWFKPTFKIDLDGGFKIGDNYFEVH